MKPASKLVLKSVRIGNARGIRLSREILAKYMLGDAPRARSAPSGPRLRGKKGARLSWDATFKEMAREREDLRDFDISLSDGLGGKGW